jgi:hypothetical protein
MLMAFRFSAPDSAPARALRRGLMLGRALPVILLVAGCAPPPPPPAPSRDGLPEVVARFDTAPARLVAALEQLCTAPAQRIVRPGPGVTECRMLLNPEATAGAILRYGGTVNRLPESVIRLRVIPQGDGVLLASAAYLEVPRTAGDVLQVVFPDPEMDRRMARVLTDLGGTLP